MTRPCHEVEAWLGQPRAALSDAQQLSLEQHLGECADCQGLHAMSRGVSARIRNSVGELGSSARERAIAQAFKGAATRPRVEHTRRRRFVLSGMALAAAAAAVLLFFFSTALRQPESAWLEGAGKLAFAHASVTLSADARVRFDASSTTLTLARGALEVEVDPTPHAPFAVQTANFRAMVLGTSFHVDARRVSVRHGHVRVVQGDRVLADLHAGEQFELGAPRPQAEEPREEARAEATPTLEAVVEPALPKSAYRDPVRRSRERAKSHSRAEKLEPVVAPTAVTSTPSPALPSTAMPRTDMPSNAVPRATTPAPSARSALALARAALARDELDEARQQLHVAEQSVRGASEHAEAGTLRAEIALRAGDRKAAIAAYLTVADEHARLPSGENALFAAAQLSASRAAQPLLQRYLELYPQGRFAAQVRTRLQAGTR